MLNMFKIITLLFCTLFIIQTFSQTTPDRATRPVQTVESPNLSARRDQSDRNLSLGAPRFVEPGLYNAFDHNGAAMGLLEREADGFNLGTRYLSSSLKNPATDEEHTSSNWIIPFLGFTVKDIISSRFYYRKITDAVKDSGDVKLNGHIGGFDLGWGVKSKIFQMGLSGHVLYAQAEDRIGNKKIMGSLPKLDLAMGSQLHPLARIGLHFGVSATFDSLRNNNDTVKIWEKIFDLGSPNPGIYFDIGDTSLFPLLSNISWDYYKTRQIGIWKKDPTEYSRRTLQYDPLWHNGHTFKMKTSYAIAAGGLKYWPSLMLEKWGRTSQRYLYNPENNQDPYLERGKCIDGLICANPDSVDLTWYTPEGLNHKWFFTGINFGLGGFIEIFNFADVFTEWEIHSLVFEVANDSKLNQDDIYNRILVGAEGKLHNIPQWKFPEHLQLLLRASFSTGTDNATIDNYQSYQFQFYDRYTTNLGSRNYDDISYYKPSYGNSIDWFNFNFGSGVVLYKKISADIYTSIYSMKNQDNSFDGFELGTTLQIKL